MIRALLLPNIIFAILVMLGLLNGCGPSDVERYGEPAFTDEELSKLDAKIVITKLTPKDGEQRLQFKESFVMPRDSLILKLPDVFLRTDKLYQRIEDLTVSGDAKLLNHMREESIKILQAKTGRRVTLSYLYRPDDPISYKAGKESFSAPIIRDDYFQFVGLMTLIYPIALIGAKSFPLTLEWEVPHDFEVFNSYGAFERLQHVTTDFDRLRDAFFLGGSHLRVRKISVRGNPVYVTFQGTWNSITDDDFIATVQPVLEEQRKTFNDDNFPYFLIHFLSVDADCRDNNIKFAGTAHPNSFRAFFPGGKFCELRAEMKQLISHELMHMWIGKKIKVGKERGHIDGKWFTEGWTDYFGRILAYRAGVLNEGKYFETLNRQLEKYFISNERLVSLNNLVQRMYRRGYSTRELEDVPYQQGEIMAWRINKRIKEASNFRYSLDDVVRDMLADADRAGGSKNFTVAEIASHVDRYAPGVFKEEFDKILRGGLFEPPRLEDCTGQPLTRNETKFLKMQRIVTQPIFYYGARLNACDRWLR